MAERPAAHPGDFSIGRVIARGLSAVARRPVATCVPALLFGVLPSLLVAYAGDHVANSDEAVIAYIVLSLWLGAVTNVTSQGALAYPVLDDGEATASGAWRSMFRALGPLAAAGALIGAATIAAGAVALAPGLLLHALWSVAGPAIVEERLPALAGLRRSAALVRPVFWRVALLNLLLIVAYFAFWLTVGMAGLYLWYGSAAFTDEGSNPAAFGLYLLSAPFLTAATAAWGAVVVALYADLRERLDGVPADRLARIFA